METYTILRAFADSWFLIAMFCFFAGVCLYAFRPGAKATHRDLAALPLRNDTALVFSDRPKPVASTSARERTARQGTVDPACSENTNPHEDPR